MKYAWSSKTIWLNAVLFTLVFLDLDGTFIFGAVSTIGNIYLRFKTTTGITIKKEA